VVRAADEEAPIMADGTGRSLRRWRLIVALVAVTACSAGACGSSSEPAADTTETSVAGAETTGTTAAGPRAADDLAPFFDAVVETDRLLQVAADAVNGGIGTDTVNIDQAARDAVFAASTTPVLDAIPTGMPSDLEQAVLLVYSGLVSRSYSLADPDCLRDVPYPRSELNPHCFSAGHAAAARFDADLAAARSPAESTPPLVAPAPDSRSVAELKIREDVILERNGGCAGSGGYVATEPIEIVWEPEVISEQTPPWDGRADGIPFRATYAPATGWRIEFNAC
jgi:hypothetical protein